jgi:uncharacterized protein (TIGR02996 family)
VSDLDALLKAILDHPEEDTPRLMYADALQERDEPGDGERAEFIREAVAYPHCEFVRLTARDPFPLLGLKPLAPVVIGRASGDPLIDAANSRTWMWGETESIGCVIHDLARELDYRPDHGFISGVRARADVWLRHGDAIVAAHPVTSVRLTTYPAVHEESHRQWRLSKEWTGTGGAFVVPENPYRAERPDGLVLNVLARRWPRITFTLPG